jgi:hypothetical protein
VRLTTSTSVPARRAALVRLLRVTAWAVPCGIPSVAVAADVHQRILLPGRRSLELRLPPDWLMVVRKGPDLSARTVVLSAAHGRPFEVTLSLDETRPNAEDMRGTMTTMMEAVKDRAVERPLRTVEIKGAQGAGLYFSATDGAAAPNEYNHLAQGMILLDGCALKFTVLTRDGQERVVADALAMIAQVKVRRSGGG